MLLKYAKAEVLEYKSASERRPDASLSAFASFDDYRTDDGFLYVRVRAISSRVNKNHDGWPSEELKKSYSTFLGKPIFVDHHNHDPKRARGVVVDAALHIEDDIEKTSSLDPYYASAPEEHLPPTWVELLLEVDAKRFPKLAKAIVDGDIDGVSMGANVERSKCSHCSNWARSPEEYCSHVRSKGAYFDYVDASGQKTSKKAYEDCYDIGFFELSFVFDPADETALLIDHKTAAKRLAAMRDVYGEEYGPRTARAMVKAASKQAGIEDWTPEEAAENVDPDVFYVVTDSGNLVASGATFEEAEEAAGGMEAVNDSGSVVMQGQEIIEAAERIQSEWGRGGVLEQPPVWEGEPSEFGRPEDLSSGYEGREGEAQRVLEWRAEQLERAGYSAEEAAELAGLNIDYHDLVNMIGQGATPEQARQIVTRTAFIHPVADDEFFGFGKTAEQNPPPQSEMTTAPEEVDTLRQDQICPICGSDMEDGICAVCNYEEPPEGFDNPDLEKAKETDLRKEEELAEDAANQMGVQPGQPTPGEGPQAGMGGAPGMTQPIQASTSFHEAAGAVSDENDKVSERTARINTQERPILPVTRKLTDKPKNQTTVKDPKKPVESNHRKETMTEATLEKTADGASPAGEGVAADKRVEVEGVGAVSGDPLSGIESENVEKDTGDFVAPHTDTWSGDEGDSLGQQDAVTSEVPGDLFSVAASTEKTAEAETLEQPAAGAGFPDHDPAHVDLEALLAEEVGDRTMTDSTATAFRSLEQAPAVTKGESGSDVGGPIGEALASAKAIVIKAMKVAEAETSLGLIDAESKFDRVAELESSSEEALDATLETLAKVKTAGLRKASATKRTAGRVPSLRPAGAADFMAVDAELDRQIEDAIW